MRTFYKLVPAIIGILTFSLAISACSSHKNRWSKYADKSFSIRMPEERKEYDKIQVTAFGKQNVHYIEWRPQSLELNKFKLFQVSYTDCPQRFTTDANRINEALDSSINVRKRDFTELEVSTQPIDLAGYPGRAFILNLPADNVITIVKQVIAGNRRYDLTVVAKKDYLTNNEMNDFFNSFQVFR